MRQGVRDCVQLGSVVKSNGPMRRRLVALVTVVAVVLVLRVRLVMKLMLRRRRRVALAVRGVRSLVTRMHRTRSASRRATAYIG